MTGARALATYQEMDVLGMSPARLVVAIYAFLLTNLRQGLRAVQRNDFEAKSRHLCRALEAVQELLLALDRKAGGDLAQRLAALYAFYSGEIVAVDQHPDAARLERLIGMVASLHAAWEEAARIVETPAGVSG